METVTISSKYQLVLPKTMRESLGLRPGMKLVVIQKGGTLTLVPERPIKSARGMLPNISYEGLREKKDRF